MRALRKVSPLVLTNAITQIATYLTKHVLPDLRRFLIDADKTSAVCSNMVYYIAAPAFKTRAKCVVDLASRPHVS